jgi:hypothetical protein
MTKLSVSTALFFWTLSALADPTAKINSGSSANNSAVTQGGIRQGQENLRKQNAITTDTRSDARFGVRNLQQQAESATEKVNPQQKADLYNLGAELLPFVAPYINNIAKACIDKIDYQSPNAEKRAGDCTKEAVGQFQSNPAAFIDRLPASEKQRLEALVQMRVKQSIRPQNKPGYMEP